MLTSGTVKQFAFDLGLDLVGIAPIDRFVNAPEGFHPKDIFPQTKSAVVFAKCLPQGAFHSSSPVIYTNANHVILDDVLRITYQLCARLEAASELLSVPIPSEPYEYWDAENRTGKGLLSLRHAGYLAGLGVMGKNTLLVNRQYGNRMTLGAVLLNIELEGDAVIEEQLCPAGCQLCINNCPVQAISGSSIIQKRCRENSIGTTKKGDSLYLCHECRKVCPNGQGVQR